MADILVRVCIHGAKLNGDEEGENVFEGNELQQLVTLGLDKMRVYGDKEKHRFMLLKFVITDMDRVLDIQTALADYYPVFCFNPECPRVDINCPAYRP